MLKSTTLRIYIALHSWVGIVCGFALFVAFYAGALTVFHHEIHAWQAPYQAITATPAAAEGQLLVDALIARHPEAREQFVVVPPGEESPQWSIMWPDKQGEWQHRNLAELQQDGHAESSALGDLINVLHYSLGIPMVGSYLMGIVSLMYGVALVSGLLIHLPKIKEDLFALRPGRNLKRYWQDAHNVIGILSLPFHLIFALTGGLFCLYALLAFALNTLVYDGKLMAEIQPAMGSLPQLSASGKPAAMLPVSELIERAKAAAPQHHAESLRFVHYGDANAAVEVFGEAERSIGPYGTLALSVVSGEVLNIQVAQQRDANHAILSSLYSLHFGLFGADTVRWLYFILGLAGAFLFYSGNLLWIESRRKRQASVQPRKLWLMAQASVGICLGVCFGVSLAFVAAKLSPMLGLPAKAAEQWACYGGWLLALTWSFARPPARGAIELLLASAVATLGIPLAHAIAGDPLWQAALRGEMGLVGLDLVAIAMALGFATLARLTWRRAHSGQDNSVWSLKPPTSAAAVEAPQALQASQEQQA